MSHAVRILVSCLVVAGSVFIGAARVEADDEGSMALGVRFDYASGDYGTGISGRSLTTSAILGYYPTARLDLELTIPYIYQSSAATTSAGHIRFGVRDNRSNAVGSAGPSSQARDAQGSSSEGLGDLVLDLGYVLVPETASVPRVRASIFVKLPTADEKQGLGTGEFDLGVGLQLSKWFGDVHAYGESTLVFQGSNDALGLKDFLTAEVGIGHMLGNRALAGVSLWAATAPSETASGLAEVRADVSMFLSSHSGISGYLGVGLVDASPDFVAGGSVFVNF